jgi:hypothetical protein
VAASNFKLGDFARMDKPPVIIPREISRVGVAMKSWRTILTVLGAVMVMVLWLIQDRQYTRNESEIKSLLHSLQGTNISKIVISHENGLILNSVSSLVACDAFAKAANTVEPYSPNHPVYAKKFFIELYLTNGQKREFEFDTMQPTDRMIYVWFERRSGDLTSYYGNCKSGALFDWMTEQAPNVALNSK